MAMQVAYDLQPSLPRESSWELRIVRARKLEGELRHASAA